MNDAADMLGVDVRTLRNWKHKQVGNKKIGRPKVKNTLGDLIAIGREWKRQGYKGSRPVIAALPWLRVRLVREVVAALKKRRNKRKQRIVLMNRVSIEGLCSGAVHVLDATDLGHRQILLVGKDRASQLIRVAQTKDGFKDEDTIKYLNDLKAENKLPLVLATDNGSQFCSKKVKAHLERERIVHLRSQPHTPQHNGACEIAIRELKDTLKESNDLAKAVNSLNFGLKRRQLKYKTSAEVDQQKKIDYTEKERIKFYKAAQKLVRLKKSGLKNAREIRKAEREAILDTLARFKLVKLTRGEQNLVMKRENIR
jgi:transposase InsO family protein